MSTPARVVLVGFDASPPAHAAVRVAAGLAGPGGQVHVLHSVHPLAEWATIEASSAGVDPREQARQRAQGERVLEQLDRTGLDGVEVRTSLVGGNPARALDRQAREDGADMIVVGAGRGVVRGRVALALVRQADRPVVVVPT